MNHHEIRARLAEVIEGLDSGRWSLPAAATRMRRVGGPLLAAALGLGVAGCPSQGPEPPPQPDPDAATSSTSSGGPVVATPMPAYAVPAPDPATPADPGPVPEYMAPGPEVEPDPGAGPDPGPRPLYAVEAAPGARRPIRRPLRPAPDAEQGSPDTGVVALYAAPDVPSPAPEQ